MVLFVFDSMELVGYIHSCAAALVAGEIILTKNECARISFLFFSVAINVEQLSPTVRICRTIVPNRFCKASI